MTDGPKHSQLDAFRAFPESTYRGLDLAGLATYAVNRLQGLGVPTTFENLVVTLFRLFPSKFSLQGFSEYPDAARVGRTLLQLGPKYRNWARGSVQKGFTLTDSGVAKAARVAASLATGTIATTSQARPSKPRTMDLAKELTPAESSALFKKWVDGRISQGEAREVFDILGAFAYTPPRALRSRAAFLENAAAQLGRDDLVQFIRAIRKHYAHLFRE